MSGLRGAKTEELAALRTAVASGEVGTPITERALVAAGGFKSIVPVVTALADLELAATLRLLDVVLAERSDLPSPPRLVWSGPVVAGARAMATEAALRELCARAEQSVLLAGYAFDHGERILDPVHAAMTRGARVELYLHIDEAPRDQEPAAFAKARVLGFFATHWPWPERPAVYYDPRTASGNDGAHASMHAKCVVVDERWALVGSANFTDRAQTRNIEVGALVDDVVFAREVVRQFHAARDLGLLVRAT